MLLVVVVDMLVDILKGSDLDEDTLQLVVDKLVKGRLLEGTLQEEGNLVLDTQLEEGREVHLDTLYVEIYLSLLTHHLHLFYCSC